MIGIDVLVPLRYDDSLIREKLSTVIGEDYKGDIKIVRRELISEGNDPLYKLRIAVTLDKWSEARLVKKSPSAHVLESLELMIKSAPLPCRPIIVGCGPCGLFATLTLAEAGVRPILIERGACMEERQKKVASFNLGGELDEETNIQFGEGGAGTFSDGKLKHGKMDRYIYKVLSEFVSCGAPENILYDVNAHVGTDLLSGIISKIKNKIISLGGEVLFNTKLTDLIIKNGSIVGIKCQKDGKETELYSQDVILAIGHSARDTFRMLDEKGLKTEARGFGIGVRIEHPREYIDKLIYGKHKSKIDSAASYRFVTHLKNGRSVYSFCMCPGGTVVAATSKKNAVVTNGMSLHGRNGENSNAAFLVSVNPNDFGNSALLGLEFQEKLEKTAFDISGDYKAPAVRMEDFLNDKVSTGFSDVIPTYPRGVVFESADAFLPDFIKGSLKTAIADFDEYKKGFYYPDAVLTGIETRTTSPIKLLRDERHEGTGIKGLFPAGEGAGYSGGIVSSATDGIKTALNILDKYL